jgi:D-alanyl-D-alanine carboxypeptidase
LPSWHASRAGSAGLFPPNVNGCSDGGNRHNHHRTRVDAKPLGDASTIVRITLREMPDHPLLDVSVALRKTFDQLVNQVVALPCFKRALALAGLAIVRGAGNPGNSRRRHRALIEAAEPAGLALCVGSGSRSQDYQADVFAAQTARWGDDEVANRYSAKPGHSQHQLGTTIDFTDMFRGLRDSSAADWLRDNAHRFGFVLPYTTHG